MRCNWPLIFYTLSVTSASHEYLPTDTDHTFTHVLLCSGTIIWHWTCHIWSCPIKLILLTGVDSCMKAAGRQARCMFSMFLHWKSMESASSEWEWEILLISPNSTDLLFGFLFGHLWQGAFSHRALIVRIRTIWGLCECVGVFFLCLSSSIGILSGSWSLLIAGTKDDFWKHFPRYCWNPGKNEIEESAEWNWLSGEINRD